MALGPGAVEIRWQSREKVGEGARIKGEGAVCVRLRQGGTEPWGAARSMGVLVTASESGSRGGGRVLPPPSSLCGRRAGVFLVVESRPEVLKVGYDSRLS